MTKSKIMKKIALIAFLLVGIAFDAAAQSKAKALADDPVVMTVNGQPVRRSEFEYSYNKNNSEGVIDKKTVDEYVDLFVNYKLKVVAAQAAKLDTLTSFRQEFAQYRDQQVLPTLVTDADLLAQAHTIYDDTKKSIGPDGLINTAHILLRLKQDASAEEQRQARVRIDSIYAALKGGADFAKLATSQSQDPGSARRGGDLGWASRGQFVKEFENAAFALKDGEMSGVVQTPYGFHIILMKGHKELEPFEYHKESILRFIEQRGLRERIATQKLDAMVNASNGQLSREQVMDHRADSVSALDPEMKYLIQEYHDGLLLYEISNRQVWEKAAKDEVGLVTYFNKNKGKYSWVEPRYKGMAYHVKTKADVKAVKKCVKNLPFDKWAEALRATFNADSVLRIRVEKGIFKKGDHALIDKMVFKKDTTVTSLEDYPIDAVYGKLLKKGPEDYNDVRGLVVADYQDELEKQWVDELRRKYPVKVNQDVLKTVNAHAPKK